MKRLFDQSKNWLPVLMLVAVALLACDPNETDPDPETELTELPELADLVGRWGISRTESGDNINTSVPCENTLEINANGNFLFVDVARANWLEGNLAFDASDSSLTLTSTDQTFELKLIEIGDGSFTLRFEENDGGDIEISTQLFTALESGDCAAFTTEELTNKWSIHSFSQEVYELSGDGDRLGTLVNTQTVEDLTENTFTIEFKGDGTAINIDYINEFNYQIGAFSTLDDHNLVVDFDASDDDPGSLVHLQSVQWPYWIFESVSFEHNDETGAEARVVTRFTVAQNSENVATIDQSAIVGKWSTSSFSEIGYQEDKEVYNDSHEQLPHNKMTMEFKDDGSFQFIDLLDAVGVRRGTYEFLDASNLLLTLEGETDEEAEDGPMLFLLRQNTEDQRIVLFNGQRAGEDHVGDGTPHGDADLEILELALVKNSGSEPGLTEETLHGQWELTEVEVLSEQNGGDQGPQIGMVIEFGSDGSGNVVFDQQVVNTMDYDFLDRSNLMVFFDNEGNGTGEDEEEPNIFHINGQSGDDLELLIYSPRDGSDDPGGSGTQNEAAQFRLILKKL